MTRFKKHSLVFLCCFWVAVLSNCGFIEFLNEDRFTYHRVRVKNNTDYTIYAQVKSKSQVLDTTGGNVNIISREIDTTYQLTESQQATLLNREMASAQSRHLEINDLVNDISELRIYRLVGTDTVESRLRVLDTDNWRIFTEDVSLSFNYFHTYILDITNDHF